MMNFFFRNEIIIQHAPLRQTPLSPQLIDEETQAQRNKIYCLKEQVGKGGKNNLNLGSMILELIFHLVDFLRIITVFFIVILNILLNFQKNNAYCRSMQMQMQMQIDTDTYFGFWKTKIKVIMPGNNSISQLTLCNNFGIFSSEIEMQTLQLIKWQHEGILRSQIYSHLVIYTSL